MIKSHRPTPPSNPRSGGILEMHILFSFFSLLIFPRSLSLPTSS